ncbi:MAG: helix-turn-helix transcriptional regulator [Kiritimatiellae bacterium]|nr:helix-turn-helix transcriptional regulator [Kiritimatiellia bacterium]
MQKTDNHKNSRYTINLGKLGITNVIEIGKLNYRTAGPSLEPHEHINAIEICYLARGNQTYAVDGKKYRLTGGDIFITNPNQTHSTAQAPEERSILYWTQIILPTSTKKFFDLSGDNASFLANRVANIKKHHFKGNNTIRTLFDRIFSLENETDKTLRHINWQNSYITLLLELLNCYSNATTEKKNERIIQLQDYITNNITEPLSIGLLAEVAGLSESRLKAVFRNSLGMPPGEYILREKVQAAKNLLRKNSMTITEIAFELSFSSSQYFATVFKQHTTLTPRQYRQR